MVSDVLLVTCGSTFLNEEHFLLSLWSVSGFSSIPTSLLVGLCTSFVSVREHVVVARKSDISTAQKAATVTGQKDLMLLHHVTGNLVRSGLTRHGAQ